MPDVEWICKLCISFPDVTEDMPWGDDLCFKVRGKIFTGMVLSDGRFPRLTLKCAPETSTNCWRLKAFLLRPTSVVTVGSSWQTPTSYPPVNSTTLFASRTTWSRQKRQEKKPHAR